MSTVRPPTSPARQAWRRLRRNGLAMAGMAVVLAISLLVVAGPWVLDIDPTRQLNWIEAQPPGFQHPDVLHAGNRFVIGEPVQSTAAVEAADDLRLRTRSQDTTEYRVILRRGRIDRLQQGAVMLEELDLSEPDLRVEEIRRGGAIGRQLSGVVLRRGEAPPADLFAEGGRVLLLRVSRPGTPVDWRIGRDAEGRVTAIQRDGEPWPAQELIVDGAEVVRIAAGDDPLVRTHLMGTDTAGRDVFARVLYGGRISLLVGLVATAVSLVIGVVYGAVSGYAGGRWDRLMMQIVDVLYGLPFMFLVILLLVLFGRNILVLFAALGAVQWLTMARIIRGQILTLTGREFIAAATLSGCSSSQTLFRHLIPNSLGPVVIYATLTVPLVILEESFLAFIGLQVEWGGQALDSWGALVKYGKDNWGDGSGSWWLLVFPAATMCLTLLALNALGSGLRDALDPQEAR